MRYWSSDVCSSDLSDIDALLPATAEPVSALILEQLRSAVATPGVAFVAPSAHPETVDARLRGQDLCDRELALTLTDGATRKDLNSVLYVKILSVRVYLCGLPNITKKKS